MFDIGWSEMLVVAVVALVVIGPKDLPAALRQAGKWVGALRKMAGDFQGQFNEALKEAELDDLRKELQDLKRTAQGFTDPTQTVKHEIRTAIESKPSTDVQSASGAVEPAANDTVATPRPADLPAPASPDSEVHFNQTAAVGDAISAAGNPPAPKPKPKARRAAKKASVVPTQDAASVETKP
ncbi:Sec-independent protein translocase protein TatB [Flaviflagellibacter deserti]|jgi:sec-independent protein translocase protein TatB|uniref:Sec-independent protein translocase protein TatB n=1 Tax=Flaviflagellibacter deserti TaxID=2267266 RepID=A0ABV9YZM0_9HYPH